jgi:hypothetical protein
MKKLLSLTALITSIYSCTPAKIATISSESVPIKKSVFVFENDTVKITYSFWADNGIMKFDIYNKMNEPVYFDWKNSAFIPNDQMVSYWQDVTNTVGSSSSYSSWLYGGVSSASRGQSKSVHQERIGVIPPHSLITKSEFKLVKTYAEMPKPGDFNKESSFLNFRNYLMFSTNEKFEGKAIIVDNQFYVSNIKMIKYKNKESSKNQNSFVVKSVYSYKK